MDISHLILLTCLQIKKLKQLLEAEKEKSALSEKYLSTKSKLNGPESPGLDRQGMNTQPEGYLSLFR